MSRPRSFWNSLKDDQKKIMETAIAVMRAQGAEVSPPEASDICSMAAGRSSLSATSRPMCES